MTPLTLAIAVNMGALALVLFLMLCQSMLPLRIAGPTRIGIPFVSLVIVGLLLGITFLTVWGILMVGDLYTPEEQRQFMQRVNGSGPAVFAFAEYLYNKGYIVEIHPPLQSPSADQNVNYIDGGDIFIIGRYGKPVERKRIEVKGSQHHWTDDKDWPFEHYFVSNKPMVDRTRGLVAAFVAVNKALTHVGIVRPADSESEWTEETIFASNSKRHETNYCCPLHLVEFLKL